jgi:hypothetical protein
MTAMTNAFPALDFEAYHRVELPALLEAGRAEVALHALAGLPPLAFRLRSGGAYTYLRRGDAVEIVPGDADATTVIELDHAAWQGLVHELEAPAGLLYAGRLACTRGNAMQLMVWESGLRALYAGRPAYDPERLDLRDRAGAVLDVERSFALEDEPDELAHFLRTAGYAFVRGVFRADEVAEMLAEAEALKGEARKGDHLSWWGKDAAGSEVLCRVTRAATKPRLGSLPGDPRVLALAALASDGLRHKKGEGDGVTVIFKRPQMVEGLGDLPWHRDCGMGGHAVLCPTLVLSLYLVEATPETGELVMLPGSHRAGCNTVHAGKRGAPDGAHFAARAGDVSLHFGDTMHAAPPPQGKDLEAYRTSAILGFARPEARHHRGEKSYNDVLHAHEDGQIDHLEKVASRA